MTPGAAATLVDWLVIAAAAKGLGRGVRGRTLVTFLRKYFGRRAVQFCTPEEVRAATDISARRCLIGFPSPLSPEEIASLPERTKDASFAAFDYLDQLPLAWTDGQQAATQRLTRVYLKPWFEPAWSYDLRMGLLPVRRYGRFSAALRLDRSLGRAGIRDGRVYDVAFAGRPNQTRFLQNGKIALVDQRVEWIAALKREAPDLKFWGGLVEVDDAKRRELESQYGDISDLLHHESKVSFPAYYRSLKQSRVVLAPGGNVPWTYRHYECLYSGAAVVTVDYRHRDMLVPLPRDNMAHVPDGESVIPAVQEALEMYHKRPRLGEENFDYLEQYLNYGAYSRRRQRLIERFVRQLD